MLATHPCRQQGRVLSSVAQLAAISTDYYTRLEQGRLSASAPVLAALARVLQLDDDQRSYWSELAGKDAGAHPTRQSDQRPEPHLDNNINVHPEDQH